jgi:hypothetical protein
MNRRQPTPRTGQSRATAQLWGKLGKVALDGAARNCVTIRVPGSCLGGKGDQHKDLKSFKRHKRRLQRAPRLARHPDYEKSDVRVRKRTEAPTLVSHILVRQARGGYPRQHLAMVEVASGGPGRKSDYCRLQFRLKG